VFFTSGVGAAVMPAGRPESSTLRNLNEYINEHLRGAARKGFFSNGGSRRDLCGVVPGGPLDPDLSHIAK
jgi:hypothetical protein